MKCRELWSIDRPHTPKQYEHPHPQDTGFRLTCYEYEDRHLEIVQEMYRDGGPRLFVEKR